MASERGLDVSGPVAITVGPQGRSVHSSRTISIADSASIAAVIACVKRVRSTARAEPAGTRDTSAERSNTDPSILISRLSCPCAFAGSSLLNEFVQTNSPKLSVWCASVDFSGRISIKRTRYPCRVSWSAASQPASPPPITLTFTSYSGPDLFSFHD